MPNVVYLRVNRRLLLLPNPRDSPTKNPPVSQAPLDVTGNLNVLAGPLTDIQKFAGTTVDWLIRVARLILDPRGAGVLHTFQRGTVQFWLNREMTDSWRQVGVGEKLTATIYEYRRLDGQPMELTRICESELDDMPTQRTREEAEFRKSLLALHTECIISGVSYDRILTASRLIPRHLGDNGVQNIFERFTGLSTSVTTSHQSIAVPLNVCLDNFASTFDFGFWSIGDNQYQVHVFFADGELNIHGLQRGQIDQNLHGHVISVGPDPPSGVFGWHYVQCVLRRFGTAEYRAVENIVHFAFEFPATDDEPDADWFWDE